MSPIHGSAVHKLEAYQPRNLFGVGSWYFSRHAGYNVDDRVIIISLFNVAKLSTGHIWVILLIRNDMIRYGTVRLNAVRYDTIRYDIGICNVL